MLFLVALLPNETQSTSVSPQYESRAPTLVVEAVDAVDGGTLVVAPEQEEVLGVFDLVRQQQADGLQRLLPSVHVVAKE